MRETLVEWMKSAVLLPVVRVWAWCFQVLGLLSKELKRRAPMDLQKKQANFSKAKVAKAVEGDTVETDSGLPE